MCLWGAGHFFMKTNSRLTTKSSFPFSFQTRDCANAALPSPADWRTTITSAGLPESPDTASGLGIISTIRQRFLKHPRQWGLPHVEHSAGSTDSLRIIALRTMQRRQRTRFVTLYVQTWCHQNTKCDIIYVNMTSTDHVWRHIHMMTSENQFIWWRHIHMTSS